MTPKAVSENVLLTKRKDGGTLQSFDVVTIGTSICSMQRELTRSTRSRPRTYLNHTEADLSVALCLLRELAGSALDADRLRRLRLTCLSNRMLLRPPPPRHFEMTKLMPFTPGTSYRCT